VPAGRVAAQEEMSADVVSIVGVSPAQQQKVHKSAYFSPHFAIFFLNPFVAQFPK
jgi:hypothetical protein